MRRRGSRCGACRYGIRSWFSVAKRGGKRRDVREGASRRRRPRRARRFVIQRWIDGDVVNRASLAWNGREVAGFTRGRLATYPGPLGPASVVQFAGIPLVKAATEELFALTAMHGLVGTQFIVARDSGVPHLIEVNRRMLPATHSGSLIGIDLAMALRAVITAQRWNGPTDLPPGPGPRLALFPQEWYRDSASDWLQMLPSDTPWHDPDLLIAMLRLSFPAADARVSNTLIQDRRDLQ